ncbi:MAG: manganese transport transcriptional regulator [Candidatus Bathyarchaeota archaeon BA2]|nr:MAG: manganese transport transcriptional regulator [Candidatus Bathyarchaeota archaeon BA2]
MVSSEAEEYLEVIYRLEEKTGFARTMELARKLKVVPGSVTNTIEGLERRGLVTHEPYKGVKLTEKGRKIALNVLRGHRLAELLLTEILHVDWSEVHEVACKLEHVIAADIMKPLEKRWDIRKHVLMEIPYRQSLEESSRKSQSP